MTRDPFYRQILERLGGPLDPDLFERCVADLLRSEHPSLVPIRGGSDAGMDGAIADGEGNAYPLVATTGVDVIGNLTRNLEAYKAGGGTREKAVLATSRELTARKRQNLERRAEEFGFTLVQVYDRAALAYRLYDSPPWCRELLNLAGDPASLSREPRTQRPLIDLPLVGRDADLAWLRSTTGDRLLVGQPGSGKTFLLRELVREERGLFVATDDLGRIAEAYRSLRPPMLILNDAHSRRELLTELRRFRSEAGAGFAIVASSWPGDAQLVAEDLNLAGPGVRKLELLARDEIVAVIKAAGIRGSNRLIRELVDQSEGKPGLAVTLAHLCRKGGVRDVALGSALKRSVHAALEPLVGPPAIEILAAFALGGDSGLGMDVVARALGLPIVELRGLVTRLAAGGVVADQGGLRLSVRPRALRHALVRDVFFCGAASLPAGPLLEASISMAGVVQTLIGARACGAEVQSDLLTGILERSGSEDDWAQFAGLGREETRWVLEQHPDRAVSIAWPTLHTAPDLIIPHLLLAAVGDPGHLHPDSRHPLGQIGQWVKDVRPGDGEALRRRRCLLAAMRSWASAGGWEVVALGCVPLVLAPDYQNNTTDPGAGRTLTTTRGLLPLEELERVGGLWDACFDVIRAIGPRSWATVLQAIRSWAYPDQSLTPGGRIPPEFEQLMRATAARMLADVVDLARGRPGVLHAASQMADDLGRDFEIPLDPDFEVIFPKRVRENGLWREDYGRQTEAVGRLVETWARQEPSSILARIARIEDEADAAGRPFPDLTHPVFLGLGRRVENPSAWARAMLEAGVAGHRAEPFLRRVAAAGGESWAELAAACLGRPAWRGAAVHAMLAMPSPHESLTEELLGHAGDYTDIVWGASLRGEIAGSTLLRLLHHGDDAVAGAAAVGEWQADPVGQVRTSLLAAWRPAIVRCPEDQNGLEQVLGADPSLALEWLSAHLGSIDRPSYDRRRVLAVILRGLDADGRRLILGVPPGDHPEEWLFAQLIGDDLELYRRFLGESRSRGQHLAPLRGAEGDGVSDTVPDLGTVWAEKARLALDVGYTPEDVVEAAFDLSMSCWGNESAMWDSWAAQFEALGSHPDGRIQRAGEVGRDRAARLRESALEREKFEAIYGPR